jgi:hypothetical protein
MVEWWPLGSVSVVFGGVVAVMTRIDRQSCANPDAKGAPMTGLRQRFLGLCLPPILFCVLDFTLTLVYQPAEYWQGDPTRIIEGSPTFHQLLSIAPAAFIVGVLVWIALFVALLILLPDTPALVTSIAIVFGHTAGTAAWLRGRYPFDYQLLVSLFVLAAVAVGLGVRWGWQAAPRTPLHLGRLSGLWRWLLIAALGAVVVYLFLWPRTAGG